MIITCEQCSIRFNLDPSLLKPEGSKVRCSQCSHIFTAFPPALEIPAEPVLELEPQPDDDTEIDFDELIPPDEDDDGHPDQDEKPDDRPEDGAPDDGTAPELPELDIEAEAGFEEIAFDESDELQMPETDALDTEAGAADIEISFEDANIDFDPDDSIDFDPVMEDAAELELEPEPEPESLEPEGLAEPTPVLEPDLETDIPALDMELDDDVAELEFDDAGIEFEPDELSLEAESAAAPGLELEPELESGTEPDAAVQDEFGSIEFEELEAIEDNSLFDPPDLADNSGQAGPPPMDEVDFQEDAFPDLEMEGPADISETETASTHTADSAPDLQIGLEMEDPTLDMEPADDVPELEFEDTGLEPTDPSLAAVSDAGPTDLPSMEEGAKAIPDEDTPDFEMEFNLAEEADDVTAADHQSEPDDEFSPYDEVLEQGTEPESDFPHANDTFPDADEEPFADEALADDDTARAISGAQPELTDPDLPSDAPAADETGTAPSPSVDMPSEPPVPSPLIEPPQSLGEEQGQPPKKKSKPALGAPALVLLVLFILVIVAYAASLFTGINIPVLSDLKIPFITQQSPPKAVEKIPEPPPLPDQKSVNGRFVSNDTAGELFIITGKVLNPAAIPYRHIKIQGTLFQKGKIKAMTQTAFCGNVISEEVLRSGNIADIMAQLSIRQGNANTNVDIRPGGTVPFMLIFSNLPDNLQNFTVEVIDFQNPQIKK